jgi:hypothetical protein
MNVKTAIAIDIPHSSPLQLLLLVIFASSYTMMKYLSYAILHISILYLLSCMIHHIGRYKDYFRCRYMFDSPSFNRKLIRMFKRISTLFNLLHQSFPLLWQKQNQCMDGNGYLIDIYGLPR